MFQLTFFVAGLTLDARRQEQKRVDMLCCLHREPEVPCCALPILASAAKPERMLRADGSDTPSMASRLASQYLPRMVLTPVGKGVVLALAVGLVAAGTVGAVQVEQNFDIEWFTPDSSPLQRTYDVRDTYFQGQNMPVRVFTKQVNYFALQSQVAQLEIGLTGNKWVVVGSLRSWYAAFVAYLADQGKSPLHPTTGGPANEADFYPWLREFLDSSSGAGYVADVVFTDSTRTQIRGVSVQAAPRACSIHRPALTLARFCHARRPECSCSTRSWTAPPRWSTRWSRCETLWPNGPTCRAWCTPSPSSSGRGSP